MKKDAFAQASAGACVYDAIKEKAKRETEAFQKELDAKERKARLEAQKEAKRLRDAEERTFVCPACNNPFEVTRGQFNKEANWHYGKVIDRYYANHTCPYCHSVVRIDGEKKIDSDFWKHLFIALVITFAISLLSVGLAKFIPYYGESHEMKVQYIGYSWDKAAYMDFQSMQTFGFYDEESETIYWCRSVMDLTSYPNKGTILNVTYYPYHALNNFISNGYGFERKVEEKNISKEEAQSIMEGCHQ